MAREDYAVVARQHFRLRQGWDRALSAGLTEEDIMAHPLEKRIELLDWYRLMSDAELAISRKHIAREKSHRK